MFPGSGPKTGRIKSLKRPRFWCLSTIACKVWSHAFPWCSSGVELFDLQLPVCFFLVLILINIKVECEFSLWFCEKSLLSALLTSCGREGTMFHANSRQWFEGAPEPRGCTYRKARIQSAQKQNWNWTDLGCLHKKSKKQLMWIAPHTHEGLKKKKNEPPKGTFWMSGVISGCSEFPHMTANKWGECGLSAIKKIASTLWILWG